MILITSEKSFLKRSKKWVLPKDFLIMDVLEDPTSKLYECGNRIWCSEMAPTPTLAKIAADPDDEDSKVKRRSIGRYIERWLNEEVIELKLGFICDVMCQNFRRTGEDMNVFMVMQNRHYKWYATSMRDHINEMFGYHLADIIDRNMTKEMQKKLITQCPKEEVFEDLSEKVKKHMRKFSPTMIRDMYSSLSA